MADAQVKLIDSSRVATRLEGQFVGQGAEGTIYKYEVILPTGATQLLAGKCYQKASDPVADEKNRRARDHERDMFQTINASDKPAPTARYEGSGDGEAGYYLFTRMEHAGTLRDKLSMQMNDAIIANFLFQLITAVSRLHAIRMIHRDLKPDNILVMRRGNLALCDFTFARIVNEGNNGYLPFDEEGIVGTPQYMAPEVLCEAKPRYSRAVDVWGIGCVAYELFSGGRQMLETNDDSAPTSNAAAANALRRRVFFRELSSVVPDETQQDFLIQCWEENPEKRARLTNLRKHKFIVNNRKKSQIEGPRAAPTTKKVIRGNFEEASDDDSNDTNLDNRVHGNSATYSPHIAIDEERKEVPLAALATRPTPKKRRPDEDAGFDDVAVISVVDSQGDEGGTNVIADAKSQQGSEYADDDPRKPKRSHKFVLTQDEAKGCGMKTQYIVGGICVAIFIIAVLLMVVFIYAL